MIVVSFFTPNDPYPRYAQRLIDSCVALRLRHQIVLCDLEPTWVETVAKKGLWMLEQMEALQEPLLWVDADGEIVRRPKLLMDCEEDYDFGIYADRKPRRWKPIGRTRPLELPKSWKDEPRWFLTGTMWFNHTEASMDLLKLWAKRCEESPKAYQQLLLQECWCEIRPHTLWLPQGYCKIRRMGWRAGESRPEVIVHDLASVRKGEKVVRQ